MGMDLIREDLMVMYEPALEYINGMMEIAMRVSGKMDPNMESVSIIIRMGMFMRDTG